MQVRHAMKTENPKGLAQSDAIGSPQHGGRADGSFDFQHLIDEEFARLDSPGPTGGEKQDPKFPKVAKAAISGEPWACRTPCDRLGLALSGGGIRSATFNLGLLQALEHQSLLKEVHYLSTVSGGGYIGGFWTAWLRRNAPRPSNEPAPYFPGKKEETAPAGEGSGLNRPEPAPIRHLREFSRFLMPRLGYFYAETWAGIVAILGGMLPALFATTALIALSYFLWFLLAWRLVGGSAPSISITVGVMTLVIQLFSEWTWRESGIWGGAKGTGKAEESFPAYVIVAIAASAAAAWLAPHIVAIQGGAAQVWLDNAGFLLDARKAPLPENGGFSWVPFALSAAWGLVAVLLLFFRALCALGATDAFTRLSQMLERATSRSVVPALIWAAFTLIWESSRCVVLPSFRPYVAAGTGASAAACGGLFYMLRDWLGKPPQDTNATRLLGKASAALKPIAPQLLANAAVALFFFLVCILIQWFGCKYSIRWVGYVASAAFLLTFVLFNPARVGLHEFYRSRICRCFLGAATAREYPEYLRPTVEQPGDDLSLGQLREGPSHPIHLVCCTANNLSGDVLGNLYRGGRSATVSLFGLSLGDDNSRMDSLRLSSVLTASAAAFNSQMGSLSMRLGPAVAFLMCALNLRLGLWVQHPRNPRKSWPLPGLPFFYEMFGYTDCDPPPPEATVGGTHPNDVRKGVRDALSYARMLHLSDGGHFENLAVYELVRRHCRYIVASDCGADSEVAFDDLANAMRKVREDFGVEIEVDVSPLCPDANGLARQHAVVGTIHYDGLAGNDKGTFIYIKPSLTGDEAPDVLEYKKRNSSFPHETTGDQFYDEPQWESYRCLGEHVGNVIFQYVEERSAPPSTGLRFVQEVFHDAIERWSLLPDRQSAVFVALNERCNALDASMRENAPPALRSEFFPEVGATKSAAPVQAVSADDEMRIMFLLMQAAQVMEDAWGTAHLSTLWSHPVNEGWMRYFERWASTPSFRRWWPLLSPIYSVRFRDFVRDRFGISIGDYNASAKSAAPGAVLKLSPDVAIADLAESRPGFAWNQWVARREALNLERPELKRFRAAVFSLILPPGRDGKPSVPLQVGFLLYRYESAKSPGYVEWGSRDLFVPPPLVGAGITTRLLDEVTKHFDESGPRDLRVAMDRSLFDLVEEPDSVPRPFTDSGSRFQRVHDISFYRSRGFDYLRTDTSGLPAAGAHAARDQHRIDWFQRH